MSLRILPSAVLKEMQLEGRVELRFASKRSDINGANWQLHFGV
jgi:hypothetical protein